MFAQQELINTSIQDLYDQSAEYDLQKSDYPINSNKLSFFANDGQAYINVPDDGLASLFGDNVSTDAVLSGITEHAHYQLMGRWGHTHFGNINKMLPHDYLYTMRSKSPELWATIMQHHVLNANKDLLIRAYGDTARAILSSRYSPVDNSDMLSVLSDVVESAQLADAKLLRGTFLTPDAMGIKAKFFDRDTDTDGGYTIGVYIGNNEIGNGKVRIAPIIQRTNCSNSIIVDNMSENTVAMRHVGSELANKVLNTAIIARCLEVADSVVDKCIEGYAHEVNALDTVLAGFAKKYQLGNTAKHNLSVGSAFGGGNPNSKMGVVNAITYMAHTSDLTADVQADYEIIAGDLLMLEGAKFDAKIKSFAKLAR